MGFGHGYEWHSFHSNKRDAEKAARKLGKTRRWNTRVKNTGFTDPKEKWAVMKQAAPKPPATTVRIDGKRFTLWGSYLYKPMAQEVARRLREGRVPPKGVRVVRAGGTFHVYRR